MVLNYSIPVNLFLNEFRFNPNQFVTSGRQMSEYRLTIMFVRLIGCQDLLEEVPPTLDNVESLSTTSSNAPDYKSLPRMSKSNRSTVKHSSGFKDESSGEY